MTKTQSTIGQRIKSLRKKHDLKQADFAAPLDVTGSYLSKIEHDLEQPGRELLLKMSQEYNVSIDWILNGERDSDKVNLTEQEALLLYAFRNMPQDEALLHLNLMLQRANKTQKPS